MLDRTGATGAMRVISLRILILTYEWTRGKSCRLSGLYIYWLD